uniref:Reverse transcriptase domain-containing protein n=1 Tax=Acrobeloides nanus TaxID=290746 RepID=A0A914CIU8_9BILA
METVVACLLDGRFRGSVAGFLIDEISDRANCDNLFLTPCIVRPDVAGVNVLIANPTNAPVILHRNMRISTASALIEEDGELIEVEGSANQTICSLSNDKPISCKPRRVPAKYREELRKHIDQLLASGVMVESDTPWVSNIVLVPKKDGSLRPCIDFRALNSVIVPDRYPIPRIDALLDKIGSGCTYFSSLDLASGFMQLPLDEDASYKCGLITEDKVYQMTHLHFGLTISTSFFARSMAKVLEGLDANVMAYVDDIVIYTKSPNFDDHLKALENVFSHASGVAQAGALMQLVEGEKSLYKAILIVVVLCLILKEDGQRCRLS